MYKAHILIISISVLFGSCINKAENNLKVSTSKINTISLVIDDQLWNGELGDSIRNKFASPVIGLPQEEPLFDINQYSSKVIKSYWTNIRNFIIIKKDADSKFEVDKDKYVTTQNVFHISGKSVSDIICVLENEASSIISTIRQSEIKESQRLTKISLLNTAIISEIFKINLEIPSEYEYILHTSNFLWLKKNIVSGSSSLLIYELPLKSITGKKNQIASIIKIRDSIGAKYIHGKDPGTIMITEEAYSPYFFKKLIRGNETYEMKGTWELKNDFMSGPFVNYVIVDQTNKRILVLEGFCYSASNEKRDFMFELESIIKSITFL
ncbi:MAG: hypothetical protein QG594_567 [Bacteroidota bacterium]|nr:hypothetical protein [Bacteroidota bacterium]